jgi:hypothetical protein
MTARDKFRVGDHVLLNDHSHSYRADHLIRVRENGLTRKGNVKVPNTWSMDFWDKIG